MESKLINQEFSILSYRHTSKWISKLGIIESKISHKLKYTWNYQFAIKKIIINRTFNTQTKVLSCSYWWCGLMINGEKVAAPPSSNSGMHHWPVAAWWLPSPRCSRLCDLLACVTATLISMMRMAVCVWFADRVVVGSFLKMSWLLFRVENSQKGFLPLWCKWQPPFNPFNMAGCTIL